MSELNRFLPVRRFLDGEIGRFRTLAEERIENLPLASAPRTYRRRLLAARCTGSCGARPIPPDFDRWLKSRFDVPEYRDHPRFQPGRRRSAGPDRGGAAFRQSPSPAACRRACHLTLPSPGLQQDPDEPGPVLYFQPRRNAAARSGGSSAPTAGCPIDHAARTRTPRASSPGWWNKIETTSPEAASRPAGPRPLLLDSIRSFLNDAQALVELEEAGTFDFFDPDKLERAAGRSGLGDPADPRHPSATPPRDTCRRQAR